MPQNNFGVYQPDGSVSPFFSVIVPVHNAAEYMSKGLQSIKDQTFKDYELIVVCDSCTDISERIARNYTDKVYVTDNHHDGLTRNVGLNYAIGQWVLFMDDDDWFLHEYAFQMIAEQIGKHGEDVMCFDFIWRHIGYAVQTRDKVYYAVWNKAWKRSYIGEIRFPHKDYVSDKMFHEAVFAKRPRAVFFNTPLYYYNFMRQGSLSEEMKQKGIMWCEPKQNQEDMNNTAEPIQKGDK